MRKSTAVKLTLVPLLAASALAHAQAPGQTDPDPSTDMYKPLPFEWSESAPANVDWTLSPPGLTPTIDDLDCDNDPNSSWRDDCAEPVEEDGVVRGGFGGYFWTGGG